MDSSKGLNFYVVRYLSGVIIQFIVKSPFMRLIHENWLRRWMLGPRSDRPGLDEAMKFMRDGDTRVGIYVEICFCQFIIKILI